MDRGEPLSIDWGRVQEEAIGHLRALIRIDTTNPPGNEARAAEYLRGILEGEGISSQIFQAAPGRGNLVARLGGAGERRPLLLLSHLDVVPAEAAKWQVPPFAGALKEGCVWGRGAIDCKGLVAMELMVMLLLHRHAVQLAGDVIFLASADEETGGRMGVAWLLENHPELLNCQYAIGESGGQGIDLGGSRLYVCQVSEKGGAGMRLRTRGSAGHASVPREGNAVLKLAQALTKVQPRAMPVHVTATVRSLIEALAGAYQGRGRDVFLSLLDPEQTNAALSHLPEPQLADSLSALLRNTATPTILDAGEKTNVIPSEAEARLDCRALPGYGLDDVQRELRQLVADEDVEITPIRPGGEPQTYELGTDNDLFYAIAATMEQLDPGSRVVPFMLSGATDSRFLVERGVTAYGFGPVLRPDFGLSAFNGLGHSHDERIPVDNLGFGSRVLFEIVRRVCGEG